MKILIVNNTKIPATEYGGTERIIWWLGKELHRRGHNISYLVAKGSSCPFAHILEYNPQQPLHGQIPDDVDLVHLHFQVVEKIKKPYLITHHANYHFQKEFDINTVFVSRNHAERHCSTAYVLNGLDPEEYGPVSFDKTRKYLLFLAYAKRPEKNLKDCLYIARKTKHQLAVVGGKHRWFKWRPWVEYKGFIGGEKKNDVLRNSQALLFPVRWHEPCAVTIFEGLYFGCPVFATPYGCLPELIDAKLGFLSNSRSELIKAVGRMDQFNHQAIHQFTCAYLSAKRMTNNYLRLYEKVLNGETINQTPPLNRGNFSRDHLLPMYD